MLPSFFDWHTKAEQHMKFCCNFDEQNKGYQGLLEVCLNMMGTLKQNR